MALATISPSSSVSPVHALTRAIPSISLVEPTPIRPPTWSTATPNSQPTPTASRHSESYRLLYKGSLVLNDESTEFPLDGICFVAHLPPTSPTIFLTNPLPLALESMHGRPFLRIASVSPLTNLLDRLDDSVDVRLYWHPEAYFANEFFLKVLWKLGGWDGTGKSKQCVRVALGDEGRSEENEIIIYGQLIPSSSTVRFHVTRLLPVQANPGLRPPRPDDPLPRRLNPVFASPGRKGVKRVYQGSPERDKDRLRKKGKILPSDLQLTSTGRVPFARARTTSTLSFGRAPSLPQSFAALRSQAPSSSLFLGAKRSVVLPRSRTGSISSIVDDDVFKVPEPVTRRIQVKTLASNSSGDRSLDLAYADAPSGSQGDSQPSSELSELELTNKNTIKKVTVAILASRGVPKDHVDFKELYNWVHRGVGFAMRKHMNMRRLEREQIKALVVKHVEMYIDEPLPAGDPF